MERELYDIGYWITLQEMQLSDVIIIDGDKKREYIIHSPDILNQLDITKYYIVITVAKEEVIAGIRQMIGEKYPEWSE